MLAGLREPRRLAAVDSGEELHATLRPYQREGLAWLHFLTGLGLSVEQFAKRIGVTAASIYRWEVSAGELKLQARPLADLARLQQKAGKRRKS